MSYVHRKKGKEHMKKYYNKRKKLVNYLVNHFEEIENVSIKR